MYNFSTHDIFRKCQRSFNVDVQLNDDFINLIKNTIAEFISKECMDIHNFVITNRNEIKLLYSAAMVENEPVNMLWKTNTQVMAPLLIMCLPKKNNDIISMAQIGRLQAKLGLLSIEHGYKTGFCLCITYKIVEAWDATKKYSFFDTDTNSHIHPVILSIGNPLDVNKPYNWAHMHNKFNPSWRRLSDSNITINN
jgi:hypothetical protein